MSHHCPPGCSRNSYLTSLHQDSIMEDDAHTLYITEIPKENLMPNIIEITDFAAPELDVYARLTENQLISRHEPEKGLFIAESPKVVLVHRQQCTVQVKKYCFDLRCFLHLQSSGNPHMTTLIRSSE